jgi:murein DD-endopeptidase MepM/ murein hydrolase activator NlpD
MFEWPVRGKVIASYGVTDFGRRNDGVNIAAPAGTPVRAAADGEVVYRGSELDGFGNLLLVKHAGGFVTAYAHNEAMLVKKGAKVRQGQVIAKVGQSGAVSSPQLHFEVRRNLKSIDPATLLSAK